MNKKEVAIAIIGGTGVYDPGLLTDIETREVYTPFGATAAPITIGTYAGARIAFLPRHGEKHRFPPHSTPYRANLWALHSLGVKKILAPRAVGGLQENMAPGVIVISDQFIDLTKKREYSYYDGGQVAHISTAEPFCSALRELAVQTADKLGIEYRDKGTSICIEGPRFSTRAESIYFKEVLKADTVGMTLVPECILARELEMCYVSLEMITDFDAWSGKTVDNVSVIQMMQKNIITIRKLLTELIPNITKAKKCNCSEALKNALM